MDLFRYVNCLFSNNDSILIFKLDVVCYFIKTMYNATEVEILHDLRLELNLGLVVQAVNVHCKNLTVGILCSSLNNLPQLPCQVPLKTPPPFHNM